MAAIEIAIDLGSSFTTIYKKGSGIVLKEPSVVCIQAGGKNLKVIEVGLKAKKMQGRTGENLVIVSPICEGIVKNMELAVVMLKSFIQKIVPASLVKSKISALVCVPCGVTDEELKDLEKVIYLSGIGKLQFVPSVIASAMGDRLKTSSPRGYVVVNIGGGTTEVAVISLNTILNACSIGIGGKLMDISVSEYIKDHYNILISGATAEKIRKDIGSLYDSDKSNIEFSGADISSSRPVTDVIGAGDVKTAVCYFYDRIAEAVQVTINSCKPDIIADITDTGIIVAGGAALITGLEQYFKSCLNLPVTLSEQPENAVILGAAALINDQRLLQAVIDNN